MSRRMLKHVGLFLLALSITLIGRTVSGGDAVQLQAHAKSITGTVVDVNNSPAAGAQVTLYSLKPKPVGPVPRPDGDRGTGDSVVAAPDASPLQKGRNLPVAKTETDASGKFTFNNVAPGPYLVAAGTGRNVAEAKVEVTDKAIPPPVALKLPSK